MHFRFSIFATWQRGALKNVMGIQCFSHNGFNIHIIFKTHSTKFLLKKTERIKVGRGQIFGVRVMTIQMSSCFLDMGGIVMQ